MGEENLLYEIDILQKANENLNKQKEEIDNTIKANEEEIQKLKEKLMLQMKEQSLTESKDEALHLVATIFKKETVGYKDENAVIEWLQTFGYPNLVKTKFTASLDKRALTKEMKTNEELKSKLDSMTETKVTEYVVVTTEENHQKMVEHIESGK